jgi:hypothetical protein
MIAAATASVACTITGNGITCNDRPGHDSAGRNSKGKRIRQWRRASANLDRSFDKLSLQFAQTHRTIDRGVSQRI